jgi:hypothetical protein
VIEDQLELEEREREWYAQQQTKREEEAQIQNFHDACYDTGDQINYLMGGYFPVALQSKTAIACVEAMTMQHVFQSYPRLDFLQDFLQEKEQSFE